MADVRDYHPSIYDKDAVRAAVASHQHLATIELSGSGEQMVVTVSTDTAGQDAERIADSVGNHALILTARAARAS
jgi:hypothetical protein